MTLAQDPANVSELGMGGVKADLAENTNPHEIAGGLRARRICGCARLLEQGLRLTGEAVAGAGDFNETLSNRAR